MPHLILEYSPNLDAVADVDRLCARLRDAMAETGAFPLAGIRVRAHRCAHFVMADGDPRCAFVHAVARIGAGRAPETRQRAGELVFAALVAGLAEASDAFELALSLEMVEIDPVAAFKRNPTHERLSRGAS